ncbi:MAG: recombination mediator RecR [candidate division WOR-3 bacterium]
MEELKKIITLLSQFPGIGRKTAERIAFFILKMDEGKVKELSSAIVLWRQLVKPCPLCFNITTRERCEICEDPKRERDTLCVVEDASDLYAIENTHSYKGLYFVLGGVIKDEGTKRALRLKELEERVKRDKIKEVIIATNPTTEGELTALHLAKLLKPFGVKLTRIARGIPFGAHLELADSITISQALEGRKEI